MPLNDPGRFWHDAFASQGSVSLRVLPSTLVFGGIATWIYLLEKVAPQIAIAVGPHEVAGATLGLLLVLRTNAGYDRWWEGRKLWGGIVNQSRNLVIAALDYGPADPEWRARIVRWTAAFAQVARARVRGERDVPELLELLGAEEAARVMAADHMPNFVDMTIGDLLREARDRHGMDGFGFLQADRERASLIDHVGGCERIVKTPLARVYSIEIRRFIVLYLASIPFALLHKLDYNWMVPPITILIAYPILALDQIGVELQDPFATRSLSHLPLTEIANNIQRDLLALLDVKQAEGLSGNRSRSGVGDHQRSSGP